MSIEYIAERELDDGTTLKLKTWVSDMIRSGQKMYQLNLVDGCLTTQFPTNYEDYTEAQVRTMYSSIQSRADLRKIMDEQRQSSD